MLKKSLFALLLFTPAMAFASAEDDIARIRPLLPAGHDVAQIHENVLRGGDAREAIQAGAGNYVLRDLNGDGLEDLLVISEENPTLQNWETNQPCEKLEYGTCDIAYGKRTMRFFTGTRDGGFTPVFANDGFVRGADEGGVFGDPLQGFQVRKNGTISYSVYGGSAWRWGYSEVIQFRKGQLYVIGQDSETMWTGDLRSDTKSINLLTGEVKETHQKDGDAPVRTKRYRINVKPLLLAKYKGQE